MSEKIGQLKMMAKDGKMRLTDVADTKTFTNLAEVTANEMHNTNNSFGLEELKDDVQEAGKITGRARKEIEGKVGRKVAEKQIIKI